MSRDPIEEMGGENLYHVAESDVLNGVDYLGMESIFLTEDEVTHKYTKEVTKAEDITYVPKRGFNLKGHFVEGITWSNRAAIDPAGESAEASCDVRITLVIHGPNPRTQITATKYFYVPHVRGHDEDGTGVAPPGATRAHEYGHAQAYIQIMKPKVEALYRKWITGKPLSEDSKKKFEAEYDQLSRERVYDQEFGKQANDAERKWFDTNPKFKRIWPKLKADIGNPSQRTEVKYGGKIHYATDVWIEIEGT